MQPLAEVGSLKLFNQGQADRRGIADALEFLRQHPAYRPNMSCVIRAGVLPLPCRQTCFVVWVECEEIGWGVTLPSSAKFCAKIIGERPSATDPKIVDFASVLNEAAVNAGVVALRDGRRVRSVELIPARLPAHGDGRKARKSIALRDALIEFVISREKDNGRSFRYLNIASAPADYGKLHSLHVRSLSKLMHDVQLNSAELNAISRQTVANILRDCGVRLPSPRRDTLLPQLS